MGQDGGRATQGAPSSSTQGGLAALSRNGTSKPVSPAEAAGGDGVTPSFPPERAANAEDPWKMPCSGVVADHWRLQSETNRCPGQLLRSLLVASPKRLRPTWPSSLKTYAQHRHAVALRYATS
jgi:hypothetical protein